MNLLAKKMNNLMLVTPKTEVDWGSYHRIRERILWEARGEFGVYDKNHPDEYLEQNFPKLLILKNIPIGVIRIDLDKEKGEAGFRRVGIIEEKQRCGYGRELMRLSEEFAVKNGFRKFAANVSIDAIEFYEKIGYTLDLSHPENNHVNPRMSKWSTKWQQANVW